MLTTTISILCVVLLSALLRSVVGQQIPMITEIIWPDVKRLGMSGYLNCTVSRQNDNNVFWIHKDNNMILTSNDRVEVDQSINQVVDGWPKYDVAKRTLGDQNIYMLIINRLVLSDAGTYTCQIVVTGASVYPSKDGMLYVLFPPTISQAQTTQTITVTEGDSFNLTCYATGYPTPNVTWVRVNGNTLPAPYNIFQRRGNVLPIINIHAADRGMYRCCADNNVRPLAQYDTSVYVNFRPQARPLQSSYGQASNRQFQITMDCIMAGYPLPDMQWYQVVGQGVNPLIDDDRHVINQMLSHGQQLSISEVWYQMTIINVQGNDYGYYICGGTNLYGSDQYKIQLFETSECQGANCPAEGGTYAGVDRILPLRFILVLSLSVSGAIFRFIF